jgi:DNA-binding MarR family transcriptional regulator
MPKPTLDSAVLEFTQTIGALIRRIRAAAASHELSLTESAVLGRLVKTGPATIADLARAESMKPQSMGTTVAALEEMGFVQRKPHPTDGRQLNIEITAKGATVRASVRAAKHKWLADAIAQLKPAERETLFEAGEILSRLVGPEKAARQSAGK